MIMGTIWKGNREAYDTNMIVYDNTCPSKSLFEFEWATIRGPQLNIVGIGEVGKVGDRAKAGRKLGCARLKMF